MLCSATSFFLPDTEEAFLTQVTVTSENSTYTSYSITSVSNLGTTTEGETTEGETTYLSFTNATQTLRHTVMSTSTELACNPSGCWTVTNCKYLGQDCLSSLISTSSTVFGCREVRLGRFSLEPVQRHERVHTSAEEVSASHAMNNNRLERLNGTLRERVKVQRAWKSVNARIAEGQPIQYNFAK